MQGILSSMNRLNYRLFLALVVLALMPTLYITVRVNLLGGFPNTYGIDIASQMQWIHLLYEVLQEALILPLYFVFGLSLTKRVDFENKVRVGLLITALLYSFLGLIIILFARPLTVFMAQDPSLLDSTVSFVRIETFASLFMILVKFMVIVFVSLNKSRYLYWILFLQMALTIFFDVFLISQLPFSLNVGVNGIAYSNIIVNLILLVLSIGLLRKEGIHVFTRLNPLRFDWVKKWIKVGAFSGIESLIRNLAFMVMIVRLMNVVREQGTFWTGNTFIWSWLLLPVLVLGDLIKKEVAEDKENIQKNTVGYFAVTTIFIAIWLITIPFWPYFLKHVMNLPNHEMVFYLVLIQLGFYITFAYNNIMDATLYGVGKTEYLLYQSIIVNVVFYGGAFILYVSGVFVPTLTGVALLFGLGVLFDFVPTVWLYRRYLKLNALTVSGFKSII